MKPITVLLADDHLIVREGLRAMLQQEADIQVVGEAKNGRQAVALAAKLGPTVVVMDISMPMLNGLEATRRILHANPTIKVLILSAHRDDAYVEHAMATGATGYMVKQTDARHLARAVREVYQGRPFFSPCITKRHNHHKRMAKSMDDTPEKNATKGSWRSSISTTPPASPATPSPPTSSEQCSDHHSNTQPKVRQCGKDGNPVA